MRTRTHTHTHSIHTHSVMLTYKYTHTYTIHVHYSFKIDCWQINTGMKDSRLNTELGARTHIHMHPHRAKNECDWLKFALLFKQIPVERKTWSFLFYMNTCWVSHLGMSPNCFTMATTVLFSASEQTHCALIICNTEWVTVALHSVLWASTKVVVALFSCYMAGATWNCCHLGANSVYTIQPCTSFQCHCSKPQMHACV